MNGETNPEGARVLRRSGTVGMISGNIGLIQDILCRKI